MISQSEYDEAINWLYDLQFFGMKLGLSNTLALLEELGNPHEKFKSIHVAGSNGKGSVCAFLTSILKESGKKSWDIYLATSQPVRGTHNNQWNSNDQN